MMTTTSQWFRRRGVAPVVVVVVAGLLTVVWSTWSDARRLQTWLTAGLPEDPLETVVKGVDDDPAHDQDTEGVFDDHVAAAQAAQATRATRHILVIIADDWRGTPVPGARMPHVSALEGNAMTVSFTAAYTQYPLCNPSRASMLTGRRPEGTGIFDLDARVNQQGVNGVASLPAFLRLHGWRTVAAGKVFHGETDPHAWDHIAAPSVERPFQATLCSRAAYKRHASKPYRVNGQPMLQDVMCKVAAANETLDMQFARAAMNVLRTHLDKRPAHPLFLSLGLVSTHLPWMTAKEFWPSQEATDAFLASKTGDRDVPLHWREPPAEERSDHVSFETSLVRGKPFTYRTVDAQTRVAFRLGYRAAIAQLDAAVGHVLDELNRLGISQQTLVVLTSDHGFALGEDGHYGKRALNEVSTRVPLIVRCPWRHDHFHRVGNTYKLPVESLGLYRSVANLVGLGDAVPKEIEGVTWWSSLVATSQVVRCKEPICPNDMNPIATHVSMLGTSIRKDDQRLTQWRKVRARKSETSDAVHFDVNCSVPGIRYTYTVGVDGAQAASWPGDFRVNDECGPL